MKKLLFLLCGILMLGSVWAQSNIRYTTVDLNMRTDTTSYSEVLMVLPRGTAVTIDDDCNCTWIPVSYQGKTGYVSARFLSKTSSGKVKAQATRTYSRVKYYTNSAGERVQSPTYYKSVPSGATALCRDGTYSFSQSRRGTCSHHGGVSKWLY